MRCPERESVRSGRDLSDETGSAPVEFVLVGLLLTVLTLGVLQLALAVYVRNVVHDAAVEGAYHGALADTEPADGAVRTTRLISAAVGGALDAQVSAVATDGAAGPGSGHAAAPGRECARNGRGARRPGIFRPVAGSDAVAGRAAANCTKEGKPCGNIGFRTPSSTPG